MAIRHATRAAVIAVTLVRPPLAPAAPRLILGRPEIASRGTVAVPVLLRARRGDQIAALNFTLDTQRLHGAVVQGMEAGRAVTLAGSTLCVSDNREQHTILALVVPQFTAPLPLIRAGRVATIEIQYGGDSPAQLRRALRLKDVVLSDSAARALRPFPSRRHQRQGRK